MRWRQLGALMVLAGVAACATAAKERQYIVFFATDSASLTSDATHVVDQIAQAVRDTSPDKVSIEGQADGGTPHDAQLAYQRGAAVASALEAKGVSAKLLDLRPGAPPPGAEGVPAHKVVVRLGA